MNYSKLTQSLAVFVLSALLSVNAFAQDKDIVELAAGTDELSTLVTAVKAADLVETLQAEGPYTVFAPTNEAFEALPEGVLEMLLKPENKDQLVSVLTYHVVAGEVMSSDLEDGMTAKTVQGSEAEVAISYGNVKIDGAKVAMADIDAENGVVHVIDTVILPPSIEEALSSTESDMEEKSEWK
jgi:uncharacterized surface protein with fasciclin (FAS1) repeats